MKTASGRLSQAGPSATDTLPFIFHPSFEAPDAERVYGGAPAEGGESRGFMADEATHAWTARMHYAAWRASRSANRRQAARWRRRYHDCRDRVVLGNRKLTFRAVQKWRPSPRLAEDMAADCQVVLIKAAAAFNPWMGVRFSTYAFTCLMRALSRLSQRHAADRLSRWLPLGAPSAPEPWCATPPESSGSAGAGLEEYLQADHALLTPREKTVLIRRFHFNGDVPERETLEEIGRALGLSKERVRQVQGDALGKLRAALLADAPDA